MVSNRQRKLEEALLHSGQFKDALQALLDWLYEVEPKMSDNNMVHGDIDTVMNLMETHKVRQRTSFILIKKSLLALFL